MKTRKTLALILSILMIISMLLTTIFAAPSAVTSADSAVEMPHDHDHGDQATAELFIVNEDWLEDIYKTFDNGFYSLKDTYVVCNTCRSYVYVANDYDHSIYLDSISTDFSTPGQAKFTFTYAFSDCNGEVWYSDEKTQTVEFNCEEAVSKTIFAKVNNQYAYTMIRRDATSHTGSATCAVAGNCTLCGASYQSDHSYSTSFTQVNEEGTYKHRRYCTTDGCTAFTDEGTCYGGTATCKDKAVCSVCENNYGELDSTHSGDTNSDHKCDLCEIALSECADEDNNHLCDVCETVLSVCVDEDNNNLCDICEADLGCKCEYSDNGFCIICGGYEPAELVDGYYEISNAGKLYWFAEKVSSGSLTVNARLTSDIVVNAGSFDENGNYISENGEAVREWTPIGNDSYKYSGTFDGIKNAETGEVFTVKGLYVNDEEKRFVGLFGYIGDDGKVQNLGVVDSYLCGYDNVGGIVGLVYNGSVTNCYNTSTVSCIATFAGGTVGNNLGGTVSNCYNTGSIGGRAYIAGVVGQVGNHGKIVNCYNTGNVTATGNYIGGIVGNSEYGSVKYCYTTGNIDGASYVGGVVGASGTGTFTSCYFLKTDSVNASLNAIGYNYMNTVTDLTNKSAEQFASGEVAYLLQGDQTTEVWGQDLSNENSLPDFYGNKVYYGYEDCGSTEMTYSNSPLSETAPEHKDENGDYACDYNCGYIFGIVVDLGARADETNTRYAEIGGVVTAIEENEDKYLVEIGENNLLIEFVEKTADGEFVKSQYFFVDMTEKTAAKLDMDTFMQSYDETSIRTNNPMGLRFMAHVLTEARNEETAFVIDEYGFIIANAETLGADELTFDFHKYASGVAYNREEGIDKVFDSSSDTKVVFTGVLKNLPVARYKTDFVCKTYTKITVSGEQYIVYGEPVVGNLYNMAASLLEIYPDNEDYSKIIFDYDNEVGVKGDEI